MDNKIFIELMSYFDQAYNEVGWSTSREATNEDIIEMFTNIALADENFKNIIIDTFDSILAAEVEVDDLLNEEE